MTVETGKPSRPSLSDRSLLMIVAALALLMRWGHLWLVRGSDLIRLPIIDSAFYHQWATSISHGNVLGDHIFFMSPLYPYLMGSVYALLGAAPWKMMLVQGALGTVTVLLLHRWATALTGRTAGFVAGVLAAIYAPFIFYDATLLTSSLILLFSIVILLKTESVLQGGRALDLWLLGIAIGLSALTRPLVLLFLPFLYIILFMDRRADAVRKAGLVTAGVLVLLIPVGLRNLIVGGEFTLTTSSAGMNFYVGNNPDANGLYWEAPFLSSVEPQYEDEEYRAVASEAVERDLTTGEAGRYWSNHALDWIIHHPLDYLALEWRKFFYFWNRAEFANNVSIYLGQAVSPLLRFDPFGFWLLAPLGLAGMILMWKRLGWRKVRVAWIWLFAYLLGAKLFFVASEYRLPAMLPLIVGASFLLVEIFNSFKFRQNETAIRLLAWGLLFFPLTNFRTDFTHRGENARMDWFNLGNTMLKQGRYEESITRFQASLAIDPYFPEALMRLAEAYYRCGKVDEATAIGKRVNLEKPESILKLIHGEALQEAYSLLDEGNFRDAMKEFSYAGWDAAAAAAETTRVSRLMEAQKSYQTGDYAQALDHYKNVVTADSLPDPMVLHNIGFIFWQMSQADSAERYLLRALEVDSMFTPAVMLVARIYNATGRRDEAEALLHRINASGGSSQSLLDKVRVEVDSLTDLEQWEDALVAYGAYGKLGYDIEAEDKARLGRLQLEVGNFDDAVRLLSEAEAAGVQYTDLPLYKGRALAGLQRPEEALAEIQRAVAKDPQSVDGRIALARMYLARKQAAKALKELEDVQNMEILDASLKKEYQTLYDSLKTHQ